MIAKEKIIAMLFVMNICMPVYQIEAGQALGKLSQTIQVNPITVIVAGGLPLSIVLLVHSYNQQRNAWNKQQQLKHPKHLKKSD